MMILTAIAVMITATLIQHLGLAEAMIGVASKIASCNQCFVFWSTLLVLFFGFEHCNIVMVAMLSILASYLSNWFVLLLIYLQRLFDKIYGEER